MNDIAELQAKFDRHLGYLKEMNEAFIRLWKENDELRREIQRLREGDEPVMVER